LTDPAYTYWHDCLYILRTNLSQEETAEAVEQFRNIIDERGGGLVKLEEMGRRRMTYEINREREGFYVDMIFWGGAPVIDELNRVLRIDSRVIRHIIVRETKRQFHRRLQDMAKGEGQPAAEEGIEPSEAAAEAVTIVAPVTEVAAVAAPDEVVAEAPEEIAAETPEEIVAEAPEEIVVETPEEVTVETPEEIVEAPEAPAEETTAPEDGDEEEG
jgi:small subunit ribosomal protein S6